MSKSFEALLEGYRQFRKKYVEEDQELMKKLHVKGQTPKTMVVACSDSRVDPAILLQCDPGDLFVVRNIANIVPPYEKDDKHHGTSAALEFAICYLGIQHLVVLGHSACGGIRAKLGQQPLHQDDFISNWMKQLTLTSNESHDCDEFAKASLLWSYKNCLSFPWIKSRLESKSLKIDLWFFDIDGAKVNAYDFEEESFKELSL